MATPLCTGLLFPCGVVCGPPLCASGKVPVWLCCARLHVHMTQQMTAAHTKRCIPAPPPANDLQAVGIGRFEPQHGGALTTGEALKLCKDYDTCGFPLPYRGAEF